MLNQMHCFLSTSSEEIVREICVCQTLLSKSVMLSFNRAEEFIRMALGSENIFEPWIELRKASQREELAVEATPESVRGTFEVPIVTSGRQVAKNI